MKVAVTGTRGIPSIQGGVETHCEQLYPLLAAMGVDVTLMRRRHYADAVGAAAGLSQWRGVGLRDIYAPRRKSLEAIVHTFLAVIEARRMGADIVHIHAVGPSLMVPFARLLGMKVVMTNHGPDYERAKWGRVAAAVIRLGERLGSRFSNRIIAISPAIARNVKEKYGRECALIPNGVTPRAVPADSVSAIASFGLMPRRYIVAVGRFVPEKGFDRLMEAYALLRRSSRIPDDFRLVIAGDADHESEYSRRLRDMAAAAEGVVLTGFITGDTLASVVGNAALFVMPSTHEGLPIALLEAMSYRLDVAVSDIEACRLPELDAGDFFDATDTESIAGRIASKLAAPATPRDYDLTRYSWPDIARATLNLYRGLCNDKEDN